MNRIEALRIILNHTQEDPVVAMCAATSRELASVEDRANHLYLLDSMGLTVSVGTGLALALEHAAVEKVVVIDGDGSTWMNLGALATVGFMRPQKLLIILLDNGVYASTGNIPTYSGRLDIGAVGAACGIDALEARDEDELERHLARATRAPGPLLLVARIQPGNAAGVPLLLTDPASLAARFSGWLLNKEDRT